MRHRRKIRFFPNVDPSKDRKIRRVDPRSGEVEEEALAHEGNKASRAIYLKNGLVSIL
jgi:coronin-1B/1C/6